jgi:hypothetical protein
MSTQVRNTRVDPNNPFAKNSSVGMGGAGAHVAVRRGSRDIPLGIVNEATSNTSSALNAEESRQQLQQVLQRTSNRNESLDSNSNSNLTDRSNSNGLSGGANILTTVRNEVGPVNTRGRKSIPKTPSPKKMDIIIQKDLANKQRFQQSLYSNEAPVDQQQQGLRPHIPANVASSSSRGYRSTFPHPPADSESGIFNNQQRKINVENPYRVINGANQHVSVGVADNEGDANKLKASAAGVSGRFMNVNFPSLSRLPFGSKSNNAVPTTNNLANKKMTHALMGGSRSTGILYEYNDNQPINRSAAMVHSGANVIHQHEYSTGNHH